MLRGSVRLYLYAPYPTKLAIDVDGQPLPFVSGNPGPPTASGYFKVLDQNASNSPARWTVEIQPPDNKLFNPSFVVNVADVSLNPSCAGSDCKSSAVPLKLVTRNSYLMAITMSGNGQGTVSWSGSGATSTPVNGTCPLSCAVDFGQSASVTLTPNPSSNSTFDGWQGACASFGSGNCSVTLNGTAVGMDAKFRLTSITSAPPACSTPSIDTPLCPADGHFDLGVASCDAQGYYCCSDGFSSSHAGCTSSQFSFRVAPTCPFPDDTLSPQGACTPP